MNRRQTLKLLSSGATALAFSPTTVFAEEAKGAMKKIPSSGEEIPVIGMGTWRTFNVGSDTVLRDRCAEVLKTFFANGGSMIDNSPMYGSAREVVGYALKKIGIPKNFFSAEKIFTEDGMATRTQTAESAGLWGVKSFDLMQIHNLVAWQEHLATLRKMKEEGVIRYLGITTSHGRRHVDLEKIMKSEPLDFVQLTYNITNREVEERLLPVAAEKGIAIIANRPFDGAELFNLVKSKNAKLPEYAAEIGCTTWAAFFLKFIVSHPAVTCAIPATSKVAHMQENMAARLGTMPDQETRKRMIETITKL
ncbi:MAG: aldo/keto reductase [Verrucomicrobiia bacterium Tous-C3TDCM]|nr:MAG: aldo/keto reductase [Verrucomicrobiae bacterium Tous-C3TDCM]PAZ05763.1 MAG: aldo/keto reductase [Verrucomicrobiae bacterium AMD-G2]